MLLCRASDVTYHTCLAPAAAHPYARQIWHGLTVRAVCHADRHSGSQLQPVQPDTIFVRNDHQPLQDAL